MRRLISLIFFAALSFGGELADLSNECKKGNDEICKRLSLAIKNLELACDEGGEKNAMYCAGLGYFYEFDKVFTKELLIGRKMMREIKFRAWLKEHKTMVNVAEIDINHQLIYHYGFDDFEGNFENFNSIELLQYPLILYNTLEFFHHTFYTSTFPSLLLFYTSFTICFWTIYFSIIPLFI